MPRKVTIADVFTVVDAAALFEVVYDNTVIGEYWNTIDLIRAHGNRIVEYVLTEYNEDTHEIVFTVEVE